MSIWQIIVYINISFWLVLFAWSFCEEIRERIIEKKKRKKYEQIMKELENKKDGDDV